jgi:glycosyltransferase involved in cell wall biosynthesis
MKISVCLASYNGEKFIQEQLGSILNQLSDNDEIIISDDGSTDATKNIILSFSDPRIKLLANEAIIKNGQPDNYRVTRNFSNALIHATGDIIFLSDQDDVWVEYKVKEILKVFENQNIGLVVHDAWVVNDQDNVIADSYFNTLRSGSGFLKNMFKNTYLGCCMAFRKSILAESLPFPENLIAHDMWIGFMAERLGNVQFIDQKLVKFRRHGSTVTLSAKKSTYSFLFKIKYRIQFVIQFMSRTLI